MNLVDADLRRDVVLRAKSNLEKVGARILGPVLNQVSLADLGYYSYYYYGYYDREDEPKKQSRLQRWFGGGRRGR